MKMLSRSTVSAAWSDRMEVGAMVPRPGPVHGAYPLQDAPNRAHSPSMAWLQAWWRSAARPTAARNRRFLIEVRQAQLDWAGMSAAARAQQLMALRVSLGTKGLAIDLAARGFGLIALVVREHMGFELHDVQLLAGWWMLGQRLAEMATGEGKTLTVLLTAACAAMAGIPVHVLTANDYLARRDAEQLRPIYAALGLNVAFVTAASTPDERKRAYRADVVHVTAKEVAFDHLRDRAARTVGDLDAMVLRGLCMAVVDEADSILIDEACTPLILARAADLNEAGQRYRLALFLARKLQADVDYVCSPDMQVRITEAGQARLSQLGEGMQGAWRWRRYRHEQVSCALQALHVFRKDVHYLVRDEAIHIIDDTTGRLAVGRAWSRGLHQMIAIKEGVPPQPENETLTQTSYQSFFPRYLRLAGLSGTLYEDRAEMLRVYGLPTCKVPLRVPSRREVLGTRIVDMASQKWALVVERARAEAARGRPVLIGTDSVADSDAVARALTLMDVPHQVLNARQDEALGQQEQSVVAQAGQAGRITVATHMAGRGTDVHLSDEAIANGGLHVINTNLNRSRRIDRQLMGRCARQGMPGSCETILSWEDACWREWAGSGVLGLAVRGARAGLGGAYLKRWLCAHAQMEAEARSRRRRWGMLLTESLMARHLAMAGREDWA